MISLHKHVQNGVCSILHIVHTSQKPHNFMKFGQLDFVQILQDCSTNTNYGIGNNIVKIYCVDVE